MNKLTITIFSVICSTLLVIDLPAQDRSKPKPGVTITGTMGITYEGYGLNIKTSGSGIYTPRRPWNQVRFNFTPIALIKITAI